MHKNQELQSTQKASGMERPAPTHMILRARLVSWRARLAKPAQTLRKPGEASRPIISLGVARKMLTKLASTRLKMHIFYCRREIIHFVFLKIYPGHTMGEKAFVFRVIEEAIVYSLNFKL